MSLTGLAFMLAFAGMLVLALVRGPMWGLYTYVAVFYVHPPSRWWGEALPDMRWSLLAAAVTFIASFRVPPVQGRPSWISTTPAKLLIAYTVWLWIQSFWALSLSDHMQLTMLFTKYVILFYLCYRLIDTREKVLGFLAAHIAGCLYLGWIAYNTRVSGRLEGVGGPGIDEANALAMQMGTAVSCAAMFILGEKNWRRWFAFAAMPFLLNTMVLAGSRGAFLALLASGVTLWYMKPAIHRRAFYVYAVLGLSLFGILANGIFWNRMDTITAVAAEDEEVDRSAEARIVLLRAQWEMAKKYPLGAGHRGTAVLSPQYIDTYYLSATRSGDESQRARSSHNTFMTALVEQGIPGAILFLAGWLWVARTLVRMKNMANKGLPPEITLLAAAVGGALTMVLVAGLFVDYIKAEVQWWMFVLLAVLFDLARACTVPAQQASAASPRPISPHPAAR